MFANRFTVVIDACSLVPVLQRNLLLSFAEAELFRPRWSAIILDESERALNKLFSGYGRSEPAHDARKAIAAMNLAFEDALVTGFEPLIDGIIGLPDADDRHVVAAAIETRASVIVTENLKDFPVSALSKHDLEALSTDQFLANSIDLEPARAIKATAKMLDRLQRPDLGFDGLISKLEANGLTQSADQLLIHWT